jgi:hypothetical protein
MMKYIGFEREEEAEAWTRSRINVDNGIGFFRAMSAVDDNDAFSCVVVFTNFTPRNIDVNIAAASGNWATPKETVLMFNKIFSYTFTELKAVRVTALIASKNITSKTFVKHLGFKLEGNMRKALPDDDLEIYGFLAEDYYSHAWRRGTNG